MANENVVDELIIRLRLDAEQYSEAEEKIDAKASGTEKKQKDRDAKRTTRERDQQSRWKTMAASAKGLGIELAAVAGFAAAVGLAIVGTLSGLNTFELGLRRQGVATGMSNREMQAWGSTARRLGADADAGAQAVADLAREQKQFNLTGEAPTMQALARIGVRVGADMPVTDMLGQAQDIYRRSAPAQQQQIESQLSAQGVSGDLILMIKSEKDARAAYSQSLKEATAENKQALDAFNDAVASAKANAISIANSLATVLAPEIQATAKWFNTIAVDASRFSERMAAAGGGIDGFLKVVNEESPLLGQVLKQTAKSLNALGEVVDVVAYGLKLLSSVTKDLVEWATSSLSKIAGQDSTIGHGVKAVLNTTDNVGNWLSKQWRGLVGEARTEGPAPVQSLIDNTTNNKTNTNNTNKANNTINAPASATSSAAVNTVMSTLITKYGMSVSAAAATTANLQEESGINPAAYNSKGGGQGAQGIAQWRGPRIAAFRAKYGMNPRDASIDQQLEFMMTDPYEHALLEKAQAQGGDTVAQGAAVSRIYEAHGDVSKDAYRGQQARVIESQYNANMPANSDNNLISRNSNNAQASVVISGPVTVNANNPTELMASIQRQSSVQNFNSAVR